MNEKPLILIVDDSPTNIMVLMDFLKADYSVIAARSGLAALRLAAGSPKPDIILLDVMMPEMDGYQTLELLKAESRNGHDSGHHRHRPER
jgi:putative two-component system response regulator